jgi:hypothetical protein
MQASNTPFYDIREYGNDGDLMLVRIKVNSHLVCHQQYHNV